MSITQEEFRKRIHEIIQDKIFFSNISGNPVEVVDKLPEEIVPGKVLFDGLTLFDGIEGIEDDIQQMWFLRITPLRLLPRMPSKDARAKMSFLARSHSSHETK
jgi:hypothetical protein